MGTSDKPSAQAGTGAVHARGSGACAGGDRRTVACAGCQATTAPGEGSRVCSRLEAVPRKPARRTLSWMSSSSARLCLRGRRHASRLGARNESSVSPNRTAPSHQWHVSLWFALMRPGEPSEDGVAHASVVVNGHVAAGILMANTRCAHDHIAHWLGVASCASRNRHWHPRPTLEGPRCPRVVAGEPLFLHIGPGVKRYSNKNVPAGPPVPVAAGVPGDWKMAERESNPDTRFQGVSAYLRTASSVERLPSTTTPRCRLASTARPRGCCFVLIILDPQEEPPPIRRP